MIDEQALAIDLYLLPAKQRKRLLSSIPEKFRGRLYSYFERFDQASASEKGDAEALPDRNNLYSRTAHIAKLIPGASAGFISRFGRVLDDEEGVLPPSMAQALRDYAAVAGDANEH